MELLDRVNLLLGINDKDVLMQIFIEDAQTEVIDYCNLSTYNVKFDGTVAKMVIQNYNKSKIQGIISESFSGVSQSYIDGYTNDVKQFLNKNRKARFIWLMTGWKLITAW